MEEKIKNPELQKLALDIFNQTGSGHEVARRLNIGSTTAYRILHLAGADVPNRTDPKPRRRKIPFEKEQEIVDDYLSGTMTFSEMRDKYSCGEWAIRKVVRNNTDFIKQRGGQYKVFNNEEKEEVLKLYNGGLTQTQIAVKFGCSQVQISRVLNSFGIKYLGKARREHHGSWKGGRIRNADGYIHVLAEDYPELSSMKSSNGYIPEHRLVMALHIGRPLSKKETVHHINGIPDDNRIENLQLRQGQHGNGVVMQCACCGSYNIKNVKIADNEDD